MMAVIMPMILIMKANDHDQNDDQNDVNDFVPGGDSDSGVHKEAMPSTD